MHGEADRVVSEFTALAAKADDVYRRLPPHRRDAFYQLVLLPTLAAAQVNAARNDCAGLEVRLAEPQDVDGRFPLVVANLLTHAHLALAAQYARLVSPAGHLVLGGMLDGEDARVAQALAGLGFGTRWCVPIDGWASLLLAAPSH